ncbi:hypothetical protein [Cohnella cellulosilytica]|uniref:Uncharacterized protein n=1 Tax=Cohnella cellulosilytica TaxID=986710 RepID=A0ABW2FDE0_9BACL
MSDTHSNQPDLHKKEAHEEVESQTAAAAATDAAASAAPGPASPLAAMDPKKLAELLKNPTASLQLQPQTDWIYGALGAAAGVVGFVLWNWLFQEAIKTKLGIFGAWGGLAIGNLFGVSVPAKFLLLGLFSIVLLAGSLTLIGNWRGARKRDWREAAAYLGGTQWLFGAAWIVSGLLAFVSLQLSMLLGLFLLLVNLVLLVGLAQDLHEVGRERKFLYITYSLAAYSLLFYLITSILA